MGLFPKSPKSSFEKLARRYLPKDFFHVASTGDSLPLHEEEVDFAFILLGEAEAPRFARAAAEMIRVAVAHDIDVTGHSGSLFQLTIRQRRGRDSRRLRLLIVEEILRQLGNSVSIVHGSARALVGCVGVEARVCCGAFLPSTREFLGLLLKLGPGEARQA